jgi:EAL domain-containing protein (putative c-di-GMP-specific phosphodiesterase class I)
MADDLELAAIVRSTIDLALNLNLRVVAEGVEDARTARMLADLGCDVVQGYYFAAPTRSHEVEHMLADGIRALRPCPAAEPGNACCLRPAS